MIFDSLVADFDGEIGDEQSQQTLNCALFRQSQPGLFNNLGSTSFFDSKLCRFHDR